MRKIKGQGIVYVGKHDLNALLHWAAVGVSMSTGGSYSSDIEEILEEYSKQVGFYIHSDSRTFAKPDKVGP